MNNLANYLMLLLHVVTGTVVSDILVRNHLFTYWRDIEMAQKVIDGDTDMCQLMHLILRWLKIRATHFPLFSP